MRLLDLNIKIKFQLKSYWNKRLKLVTLVLEIRIRLVYSQGGPAFLLGGAGPPGPPSGYASGNIQVYVFERQLRDKQINLLLMVPH